MTSPCTLRIFQSVSPSNNNPTASRSATLHSLLTELINLVHTRSIRQFCLPLCRGPFLSQLVDKLHRVTVVTMISFIPDSCLRIAPYVQTRPSSLFRYLSMQMARESTMCVPVAECIFYFTGALQAASQPRSSQSVCIDLNLGLDFTTRLRAVNRAK